MSSNQPDENTPLIAVVEVRNPPPRPLYRHSTIRRLCSCCLGSLLVFFLIAVGLVLIFVPDCEGKRQWRNKNGLPCLPKLPFPKHGGQVTTQAMTYESLVGILQSTPNETMAREWSKYYTSGPHLGGKNRSQAEWTRDRWVEFGIAQADLVEYEVYLNYPIDHRLALLEKSKSGWNVTYEATLKEDVLPEDPTSGLNSRIPTFHGYSASGNVTAPFVFVNYGTKEDFQDLVAANVSLNGSIALARYGKIFRGLKVKRAQDLGMIGVVLYTDPGDDGNVTEANGVATYPKGVSDSWFFDSANE
jgi:N-acetylated-alpha-linked acidic dipeptidase